MHDTQAPASTRADRIRRDLAASKVPGLTFRGAAQGLELWVLPAPHGGAAKWVLYCLAPGYDDPIWQHDLSPDHVWTIPTLSAVMDDLEFALSVPDELVGRTSAWQLGSNWITVDDAWSTTEGPPVGKAKAGSTAPETWTPTITGDLTTSTTLEGDFEIELRKPEQAAPLIRIEASRAGLEWLRVSLPRALLDIALSMDPTLAGPNPAHKGPEPHPDSFAGRRQKRAREIAGTVDPRHP